MKLFFLCFGNLREKPVESILVRNSYTVVCMVVYKDNALCMLSHFTHDNKTPSAVGGKQIQCVNVTKSNTWNRCC